MSKPTPIQVARAAFDSSDWQTAYQSYVSARLTHEVEGIDLESLAVCAYMLGRSDEALELFEEAHLCYQNQNDAASAIRAAFWLGLLLLLRGEIARGSGWITRARRLLEKESEPSVMSGYLLFSDFEQQLAEGLGSAAFETATAALEIGERFRDADLQACARHLQGRALIQQGRVGEGLAALDETMIMVTSQSLTPLMTGMIYCSVIEVCQEIRAASRSWDWTQSLTKWCEGQPDMVVFSRSCVVYRAEIMRLHGEWVAALEETRSLFRRYADGIDRTPPAAAYYEQGEIHRLRGDFRLAEEAFRNASKYGRDPQPGMALLRLAQGDSGAALKALRRAIASTNSDTIKSRLLPAFVECLLASGSYEEAESAVRELERIARIRGTELLTSIAAKSKGALLLEVGRPEEALSILRDALSGFQEVGAQYDAARVREMMGLACIRLGDAEGGQLEFEAALVAFTGLGATPDAERTASLLGKVDEGSGHGLSPREIEVLRLVAAGMTNRAIAHELSLSVRTIDRHTSNIFGKLGVATRAAATAYAYRHHLV